jgi:hypothetical protein
MDLKNSAPANPLLPPHLRNGLLQMLLFLPNYSGKQKTQESIFL